MDQIEYKLVATHIDELLSYFDRPFENAKAPSRIEVDKMGELFDVLKELAPLRKNSESKSIWLKIPRGDLEDYILIEGHDYIWSEEGEDYLEVFQSEYPEEYIWYDLNIYEGYQKGENSPFYRAVFLTKDTDVMVINADLKKEVVTEKHDTDEAVSKLLPLLTQAAKASMDMLRNGTYNKTVQEELPYYNKFGVVRRSDTWTDDQDKEELFMGLSKDVYEQFKALLESGANEESRIVGLKSFTGNDFLRACKIGYKACGYDLKDKQGSNIDLVDLYMRYADGRDEGLTPKGHGLCSGPGIDLNDPDAWNEWYFDHNRRGGHPWEVCRGGNSTHVDLRVKSSIKELQMREAMGEITKEEAEKLRERAEWWFVVAGSAWNRACESVNFYVALHNAGFPVVLRDADAILKRFEGTDYIGIVPHCVFPGYCHDMFPGKYGEMLDFINVYDEDIEKFGDKIEWLPEEPAKLKDI